MENRPIKVLHFIASLEVGGAERMLLTLIKNSQNKDIEHVICTIYNRGSLVNEAKAAGIKIQSLNLPCKYLYPVAYPLFLFKVLSLKPDIINSFLLQENLIARIVGKLILRKKVICGKRDTDTGKSKIKVWFDKITLGLADLHISNSLAGANELISYGVPKEKVLHIPNGKNWSELESKLTKEEAKQKLGLNQDDFVIGYVARLYEFKGQKYAIRAMPNILKKNKTAKLILVGSGVMLNELQQLVKDLHVENSIVFLGERKDIPDILKSFDIFVFPSLREGLPGALMEAMAAGLPVIATNIDGNEELIEDEKHGLLIQPQNVLQLSAAIDYLIRSPKIREGIGKAARQKMLKEYSVEKMVKRFEETYIRKRAESTTF
ncbi:MAG: glycosyltransferase [Candidatus Micrarchaeota archaeon]